MNTRIECGGLGEETNSMLLAALPMPCHAAYSLCTTQYMQQLSIISRHRHQYKPFMWGRKRAVPPGTTLALGWRRHRNIRNLKSTPPLTIPNGPPLSQHQRHDAESTLLVGITTASSCFLYCSPSSSQSTENTVHQSCYP